MSHDPLQHARQLLSTGRHAQALADLQRLAGKRGGDAGFLSLLALAMEMNGKHDQAVYHAGRACEIAPRDARLWTNLGVLHQSDPGGGEARARACFERAMEIAPAAHEARVGLVNLLLQRSSFAPALAMCEAMPPGTIHDQLAVSHVHALMGLGRTREALALVDRAIGAFPREPKLRSARACALLYHDAATPAETALAHADYGSLQDQLTGGVRLCAPRRTIPPGERVRVGFLSADFRQHSVAYFARAFFEHRDRPRFHVTAYSNHTTHDAMTQRFEAWSDRWRGDLPKGDHALAELIAGDQLDILVELSGHSAGHRLGALAMKPAPVIATWCGYPDTTGLRSVDFRIVDHCTDPESPDPRFPSDPPAHERVTERLVRLDPCFLCYAPAPDAPTPSRSDRTGGPVFGSFNTSRKINQTVIALWATLLREAPDALLLLKANDLSDPAITDRIERGFEREGVAERVRIVPPTAGYAEHLAWYSHIDVALDPVPYHGTTTTAEALWMGVPVVTLVGRTHAGRVGVSLLHAVGLDDLVTYDESAYCRVVRGLARDPTRLEHCRRHLRERVRTGPLGDGPAFARRLGDALEAMASGALSGRWASNT